MDFQVLAADLAQWMKQYAVQAHADGYVVGLSGGVDSSVTAALAVKAVGADNTLGVLMPCHSQALDAEYARTVAQALDIEVHSLSLGPVYDLLLETLPSGPDIARVNIKPRLRMTVLYYLAQSRGFLVAGTGNKPELMVGYFTKYGDGGVDIEPLGELYKHEVRGLARVLSIPATIIERPPSAGLWPGQTDEEELGITYAELDEILDAMTAGGPIPAPKATVERVKQMMVNSAHKRATPPSFPMDRSSDRYAVS
jgi:NAD+ synthase